MLPVSSQGYDDGYGGEYDDESYEAYEDNYGTQSKRCAYIHTQTKPFESFSPFFQSLSMIDHYVSSDSQPGHRSRTTTSNC